MTSSVPTPLQSVCNSTKYYYNSNAIFPDINCFTWNTPIAEELLSPIVKSALKVCLTYMSRIGEILTLTVAHICQPDRVISYGSKRSNGYLLYLPGLSSQVEKWTDCTDKTPLFPVSYIKVYRECVKSGILLNDGEGGNNKRAHAHRYLFAREEVDKIGAAGVKIALHHKSIKSQGAYLEDKDAFEKMVACQATLDLFDEGAYEVPLRIVAAKKKSYNRRKSH
jgi:hypothetical protein